MNNILRPLWVITFATTLFGGSLLAAFPTVYLKPVVLQQFHSPTNILSAPDASGRVFVTDQPGIIYIIQDGMQRPTPFLDISNTAATVAHRKVIGVTTNYSERGLLGMAFHNGFADPLSSGYRKFYLNYNKTYQAGVDPPPPVADHTPNCTTVIAEFQVSATNPNVADPLSERRLLLFSQPQSNHNGGQLEFNPNDAGMLYIASGDGGSADDNNVGHTGGASPNPRPTNCLGNGQDKTTYLGKILRINPLDPDGAGPLTYAIPTSNPFFNDASPAGLKKEIYAYGLRNPWKFSFDWRSPGAGRLFCCDVGQLRVEEVNLIVAGGNYGWRYLEGTEMPSFSSGAVTNPMPHPGGTLIAPIAQYAHPDATGTALPKLGLSGTGGYVYRGAAIPALQGKYVFGDYGATNGAPSGRLMGLEETAPNSGIFTLTEAIPLLGGNPFSARILCLGEDSTGELYVGTKISAGVLALENGLPNGGLYKIVPVPTNPPPLTLDPAKDNSIFAEELSNATGNLFAGTSPVGNLRRALLTFDLTSLPVGSRFSSAILQLNVNQIEAGTASQRNSILHKVLESWGEGTSFSATGGAAPTESDATWLYRNFSSSSPTAWSTDGGQYSSAISSSLAVNGTGLWAWQSAQLLNDVHAWAGTPSTNQGWILRSDEGINSTTKRIDSRESAAGIRPKLTLIPATPYEKWFAFYFPAFLVGQWVDPSGDLDGDGVANQIEYAYGLSPLAFDASDSFSLATTPVSAGTRNVTVTFRRDASATDLTYRLQTSANLSTWTTIAESVGGALTAGQNGGVVNSETTISGAVKLVSVTRPLTGPDTERQFIRLAVDRAP